MEGEIVAKPASAPTLDQLNAQLRTRLSELIDDATPEQILDITDSVAKLNSSYKGNSQFGEPITEEEKQERAQKEMLANMLSGD